MVYTVTLNPALDYVMRLSAPLEIGETNRAEGQPLQCGGKGINVSLVLRELEVPSVALGFVAGQTGQWLTTMLAEKGLKQEMIPLPQGQTRINVKLKGGQETEINGAGPCITPEALAQLEARLAALTEQDALVLAGSIPAGMPKDSYRRLMEPLAARGVPCVVDATGQTLLETLPCRPLLVKPNRAELAELCGHALPDDAAIAQAAAQLQEKGARNVLVSLGGDGALLRDEAGDVYRMAAPAGKLVNSVGAGDSMVAGFLAAWTQGFSSAEALRLGSAAGGATAFSQDLARKEEIQAVLKLLKIPEKAN